MGMLLTHRRERSALRRVGCEQGRLQQQDMERLPADKGISDDSTRNETAAIAVEWFQNKLSGDGRGGRLLRSIASGGIDGALQVFLGRVLGVVLWR